MLAKLGKHCVFLLLREEARPKRKIARLDVKRKRWVFGEQGEVLGLPSHARLGGLRPRAGRSCARPHRWWENERERGLYPLYPACSTSLPIATSVSLVPVSEYLAEVACFRVFKPKPFLMSVSRNSRSLLAPILVTIQIQLQWTPTFNWRRNPKTI